MNPRWVIDHRRILVSDDAVRGRIVDPVHISSPFLARDRKYVVGAVKFGARKIPILSIEAIVAVPRIADGSSKIIPAAESRRRGQRNSAHQPLAAHVGGGPVHNSRHHGG